MKLLEDMATANKSDTESAAKKPETYDYQIKYIRNICIYKYLTFYRKSEINQDNFIVNIRQDRTVLNRKAVYQKDQSDTGGPQQMDKYTFMQQMEQDAAERTKIRQERERIAQNFRR